MPKEPAASRLIMGLSTALLWVHCSADLSGAGFTRREGYRRFAASGSPAGEPLPLLDAGTVADLWPRAFRGQWGHKHVDSDTARSIAYLG